VVAANKVRGVDDRHLSRRWVHPPAVRFRARSTGTLSIPAAAGAAARERREHSRLGATRTTHSPGVGRSLPGAASTEPPTPAQKPLRGPSPQAESRPTTAAGVHSRIHLVSVGDVSRETRGSGHRDSGHRSLTLDHHRIRMERSLSGAAVLRRSTRVIPTQTTSTSFDSLRDVAEAVRTDTPRHARTRGALGVPEHPER